ncbi:MAG: hypothetical protein QXI60_09795 [Thermofilaceae archaeon]
MKGEDSSGKRAGIRNLHAIASILLIGQAKATISTLTKNRKQKK